ncbi:MAG TPA: stage 0 sporulation protein [Spirochaetes bacterium]|nr:stage 0 sporulation protein [Spirochaetota bacterium]
METTGVKLRNSFQIYYVNTNRLFVKRDTLCIIETEHGIDMGRVFRCPSHMKSKPAEAKGKLLRKATRDDLKHIPEIEALERKAFRVCREKVHEKKLDMKLVSVKALFDRTKIIFYFVAENRIDFRELVRDLATVFRTRIEMRQIGVRDEARIVGGYGPCGRQLCCVHLKEEFDPVSIKMAKEQNLNLNSLKISGMCGRLLCCLGYEYEVYRELNENLPSPGTRVTVGPKTYVVEFADPIKESVRMRCEDHIVVVTKSDILCRGKSFSVSEKVMEKLKNTVIDEYAEEPVY